MSPRNTITRLEVDWPSTSTFVSGDNDWLQQLHFHHEIVCIGYTTQPADSTDLGKVCAIVYFLLKLFVIYFVGGSPGKICSPLFKTTLNEVSVTGVTVNLKFPPNSDVPPAPVVFT